MKYRIMLAQKPKRRFSSTRLVCTSLKERNMYDDCDQPRYGTASLSFDIDKANETVTPNPSFEELYDGLTGLDGVSPSDNEKEEEEAIYPRRRLEAVEAGEAKVNSVTERELKPNNVRFAKLPAHWIGDGGEAQPVLSPRLSNWRDNIPQGGGRPASHSNPTKRLPDGDHPVPAFINTFADIESTSGLNSRLGSRGRDVLSSGSISLMKRVQMVKTRAEALLRQAQKHKERRKTPSGTISASKSFGSTEMTVQTASASSISRGSLSEILGRLHKTKTNLRRIADEYSESSTIMTESIYDPRNKQRLNDSSICLSPLHNESSMLESSEESSDAGEPTHEGRRNFTNDGGEVLRLLSLLEAINGYDLSIPHQNLDVSTDDSSVDLNFSFIKKSKEGRDG